MRSRRIQPAIWIHLAIVVACTSEVAESGEEVVASESQELRLVRGCNDSFDSIYARPQNLPPMNNNRRGDIVRCARDRTMGTDEIAASLSQRGFVGVTATNAIQIFRVTYRTTRFSGQADVSSAVVLLPAGRRTASAGADQSAAIEAASEAEATIAVEGVAADSAAAATDRAAAANRGGTRRRAPLVVFGHGTVPYGNKCAYSRNDPASDIIPGMPMGDREFGSMLAFATHGFPVIMPDYAGFVAGSPIAGYLFSQDEARSLLDATRAIQKLIQSPPDRVALVGHSQGGHAVLSAQAIARSYGLSGQLVGAVAFAPFWAPGRTFGALTGFGFDTVESPGPLAFMIEYFYTHAELIDGPGRGAELFVPSVRPALLNIVQSCEFYPSLTTLGTYAEDFLQPDFMAAVQACGFDPAACRGGLAGKWEARFKADRPTLDRRGAPVVMWHGKNDDVIATPFAKCAIDKLRQDLPGTNSTAKFTLCGDANADHESVQGNNVAWVTKWIEARAFGSPEPAACAGEEALTNPGIPLVCQTPPGNQD